MDNASEDISYSIIVLTFNRPSELRRNISSLVEVTDANGEIIVVDNCSEEPAVSTLFDFDGIRIITLPENVGVAGRNEGIKASRGNYLITLDDDVFGINTDHIRYIVESFQEYSDVGAINFKVIDDRTEQQMNWCHHRKQDLWGNSRFSTYEISEGAVAFRKRAIECSGLYPAYFFISHEGPDLALRLMDCDYDVIYDPQVVVRHAHAIAGRPGWRRYYYDTRNTIWLVIRLFPISTGMRKLFVGLGALAIYSIRDGYFRYWVKAIFDALKEIKNVGRDRKKLKGSTWNRYYQIEKQNPSVGFMLKQRLFRRGVRI